MSPTRNRTVEIYKDHKWISIPFKDIKKGDVFRMKEPDGTPVVDKEGNEEFLADLDARMNIDLIREVEASPYKRSK